MLLTWTLSVNLQWVLFCSLILSCWILLWQDLDLYCLFAGVPSLSGCAVGSCSWVEISLNSLLWGGSMWTFFSLPSQSLARIVSPILPDSSQCWAGHGCLMLNFMETVSQVSEGAIMPTLHSLGLPGLEVMWQYTQSCPYDLDKSDLLVQDVPNPWFFWEVVSRRLWSSQVVLPSSLTVHNVEQDMAVSCSTLWRLYLRSVKVQSCPPSTPWDCQDLKSCDSILSLVLMILINLTSWFKMFLILDSFGRLSAGGSDPVRWWGSEIGFGNPGRIDHCLGSRWWEVTVSFVTVLKVPSDLFTPLFKAHEEEEEMTKA